MKIEVANNEKIYIYTLPLQADSHNKGATKMTNTILFLGAGASAPFEIPTNKGFVSEFSTELLWQDAEIEEISLYGSIVDFLSKNYKPNDDLENVLNVLYKFADKVTIKKLGPSTGYYIRRYYKEQLKDDKGKFRITAESRQKRKKDVEICKILIEKLERYVWDTCNNPNEERILEIYDTFFNGIAKRLQYFTAQPSKIKYPACNIFTTNYDTCIEIYCRKRRIECNNGVDYDSLLGYPTLDFTNYKEEAKIKLFKLHGSVDLYKLQSGNIGQFIVPPSTKTISGGDEIVKEWMIYPVQEKYIYQEPFFSMFSELKNRLNECSNCIIIGHSFRDDAIKNIFLDISEPSDKNIILIDKKADKIVKNNIPEMKDYINAINKPFESEDVVSEVVEIL